MSSIAEIAKEQLHTFEKASRIVTLGLIKEIERLETVPMKYRRMEFNAELQKENEVLRLRMSEMTKVVDTELQNTSPDGDMAHAANHSMLKYIKAQFELIDDIGE